MKLLDQYVARQIASTATYAVGILSVVLVLGNVFKQLLDLLVNHSVPIQFILSFIAYILPFSLTFTIPWGFLTAVLLVFGKMSAENELIALRSSGVSIPRICATVFILAFMCVGICLWINIDVAPRAQVQMKAALYDIATSNPLALFGSDKVIDAFPGRKIYVEHNEGPELGNILVYELNDDSFPMRVIFARRGILTTDTAHNQLLLQLFDARYEERDASDPTNLLKISQGITAQETTFPISLQELYEKNKKKKSFSMQTVGELIDRQKEQQKRQSTDKDDLKRFASENSAAKTEISKRFSFSLASFAFALIGVPLAITAHRKETSVGFLLSLGVAFIYFLLILVADAVRNNPKAHPEFLIWLPNIVFISLGAWLFIRLARR